MYFIQEPPIEQWHKQQPPLPGQGFAHTLPDKVAYKHMEGEIGNNRFKFYWRAGAGIQPFPISLSM